MLTESAKKLRDPLALGLLGATGLYLIATLSVLFNSDLGEFSARAVMTQGNFVAPVFVIITVTAALLVASSEPTPMARIVVPAALGIQGLMLLLGLITWFAGYGVETEATSQAASVQAMAVTLVGFGGMAGAGKLVGTLLMLAYIGLLAIGAYLTFTVFQGLPAPVRPQQQQQWGQQQWGGQPQQQWGGQPQQQWGQPQQQQQWGQPQQQQQQWGAAGAGAAAGAAAGQAWGQPSSGESSTGYAAGGDPGQPVPGSGESSTGYAAGGDAGQQAQPQWGQQPDPTQQWGQPQPQQPEAPQQQGEPQEGEDERPGWWSPSS